VRLWVQVPRTQNLEIIEREINILAIIVGNITALSIQDRDS
jgi:hypothetical protein